MGEMLFSLPDVSKDVEHDQVEPLPLEFDERQVRHEEPAHEEEGVDVVVAVGDDLVAVDGCVAPLYLLHKIFEVFMSSYNRESNILHHIPIC